MLQSEPSPTLPYTEQESDAARQAWGANCGPHAIAAIANLKLEQVKTCLPPFRGLMNPTEMALALASAGVPHSVTKRLKTKLPCEGICRVQWEGPWLRPGAEREAYRHTHWIACSKGWVLCTAVSPYEWLPIEQWQQQLEAQNGPWHITHYYRTG